MNGPLSGEPRKSFYFIIFFLFIFHILSIMQNMIDFLIKQTLETKILTQSKYHIFDFVAKEYGKDCLLYHFKVRNGNHTFFWVIIPSNPKRE